MSGKNAFKKPQGVSGVLPIKVSIDTFYKHVNGREKGIFKR